VLDVGVGVGTTALALLDLFNTAKLQGFNLCPEIDLTCIERDLPKIELSKGNILTYARLAPLVANTGIKFADNVNWIQKDLVDSVDSDFPPSDFDLIVLGNVVSELERSKKGQARRAVIDQIIFKKLSPGGGIVLALELGQFNNPWPVKTLCNLREELLEMSFEELDPCPTTRACETINPDRCRCNKEFNIDWPEYYKALTDGKPRKPKIRSLWLAMRRGVTPTVEREVVGYFKDKFSTTVEFYQDENLGKCYVSISKNDMTNGHKKALHDIGYRISNRLSNSTTIVFYYRSDVV